VSRQVRTLKSTRERHLEERWRWGVDGKLLHFHLCREFSSEAKDPQLLSWSRATQTEDGVLLSVSMFAGFLNVLPSSWNYSSLKLHYSLKSLPSLPLWPLQQQQQQHWVNGTNSSAARVNILSDIIHSLLLSITWVRSGANGVFMTNHSSNLPWESLLRSYGFYRRPGSTLPSLCCRA